ncbi:MAG: 4-hydroxy-tetrahydrodipicolinate reductase [Armatimonadetes bacterium]|nr:4-hydroxy-tetrahydrodipicolinate reductase [Armatimonadota bacterium]
MIQLGIFGKGRLAGAIVDQLPAHPSLALAWQIDETGSPQKADVVVDASLANAVPGHLQWAMETGTNIVIGATGWDPSILDKVGKEIGVLVAPNFSLTVAFAQRLALVLGRYAALDSENDPYIVEHHHRKKADAPSGTAKALAEAVLKGCPRKTIVSTTTHEPHELHVASIRAGHEFGFHTVGLDAPGETLKLEHQVRSRAVFGDGALRAGEWIVGKKGVYTFSDMAGEVLNPIFKIDKEF